MKRMAWPVSTDSTTAISPAQATMVSATVCRMRLRCSPNVREHSSKLAEVRAELQWVDHLWGG